MKVLQVTGMHSSKYGSCERFFIEMMRQQPDDEFLLLYNSKPHSEEFLADLQSLRGGV